jgi:peptidoglycan-associated lipoprotein
VSLISHTDPRGTDEYNIALSDQRGRAVADYLSRLGIDAGRLRVIPKGEGEAIGSNESTWAQDRKVEFQWQ